MSSSQQLIPIEDIKDELVFLKDGGVSAILTTSAVNFSLLFETEQTSIIEAFAGLLNSLSFPIQIVIYSKRLDVSAYLHTLDQAINNQNSPLLQQMTANYRQFVASIIRENEVLDKQFYVCLNVTASEIGLLPKSFQNKSKKALTLLAPRLDHLIKQLARLGLRSKQLNNDELIKLFYNIYNSDGMESIKANNHPVTSPSPAATASPPLPAPKLQPPTPPSPPPPSPAVSVNHLTPPFIVEELNDDLGP